MFYPGISRFLGGQWREIAELFSPETPERRLGARMARLDADLALVQARLLRCRQKAEQVRNRLELLSLPWLTTDSNAFSSKTPPTRRQRIECLRERLQALERVYTRLLALLENRKQRLAALREELLSLEPRETDDRGTDSDHVV